MSEHEARYRIRRAAQTLIQCIGSAGRPESLEETVERAVKVIESMRQGVIAEGDYDARTMRVSYSTGDSRVTICATLGASPDHGDTIDDLFPGTGGMLSVWRKSGFAAKEEG